MRMTRKTTSDAEVDEDADAGVGADAGAAALAAAPSRVTQSSVDSAEVRLSAASGGRSGCGGRCSSRSHGDTMRALQHRRLLRMGRTPAAARRAARRLACGPAAGSS